MKRWTLPCVLACLCAAGGCSGPADREPIRVGVLHSLTGTMALSERSVIDATILAVEELNERGGVLGRRVEAIVADGRSDPAAFAVEAERLILTPGMSAVFGCWTSASRKTVRPVFERHNHLLFYPVQYEGIEQSPNIVYTGAAPNQQILPAVDWCMRELGAKKFFLVGSDYVFPRTAHALIRDHVTALGGVIAGEEFVPLGSSDFETVVRRIAEAKPDVVLNCVNGDGNIALFDEMREANIKADTMPAVSFSIAEDELRSMDVKQMAGNYCAWNYFQTVPTEENQAFVRRFRQRYGAGRVTDDPMEAAYFGVHLWARAAELTGSPAPSAVRDRIRGQSFAAPEGPVMIDPENQHTWKTARIGRIRADGQFDIVWTSPQRVRPEPFPERKSRNEWELFLKNLYDEWGGQWSRPSPEAAERPGDVRNPKPTERKDTP